MFGFGKSGKDRQKGETQERPQKSRGWLERLKGGLAKTRASFTDGLANLILGRKQIDEELLEELETRLLMADVGVEATREIIDDLTDQVSRHELRDPQALVGALKAHLTRILRAVEAPLEISRGEHSPFVILVVGVNGVGKTTTIGKLAHYYREQGLSVMLAAGDTFRAAAVEQLQAWGQRNDVPVVAQHTGADSASVIYDALQAARARGTDLLIADTAGRLHTQSNLMAELEKIHRVMGRIDESAPHEVMLVLDAGTGQNALSQARQFHQAVNLTGLTITKLDGTAKGGIVIAIARSMNLPIRFIGVGEGKEDLRPFRAEEFVEALFARGEETGG